MEAASVLEKQFSSWRVTKTVDTQVENKKNSPKMSQDNSKLEFEYDQTSPRSMTKKKAPSNQKFHRSLQPHGEVAEGEPRSRAENSLANDDQKGGNAEDLLQPGRSCCKGVQFERPEKWTTNDEMKLFFSLRLV